MKAEYISPFIDSALNVLKTMAKTEAVPQKPYVKENHLTQGVITGLIGMASSELNGNMILSFEESVILDVVSKMLMEEFTELNDEITDAVGELTNMISGGSKKILADMGHKFDMATPIMVVGKGIELKQLADHPVISIEFVNDKGRFWIEANLAPTSSKK